MQQSISQTLRFVLALVLLPRLLAVCFSTIAFASQAGAQDVSDATTEHTEPARARFGIGVGLAAANGNIGGTLYLEGGAQITSYHAVSIRGFVAVLGRSDPRSILGFDVPATDLATSLMYTYTPADWFELQVGLGIDHSVHYTEGARMERVRPALDLRAAFLAGDHGPGRRGAFDMGFAVHITSAGDVVSQLTIGLRTH